MLSGVVLRSPIHTGASTGFVALIVVWCLATPVAALDVVQMRWGFDGKVVRNRFNVLSVLVNQPLPKAFEGELRLVKQTVGGAPVDAPLVESLFVGPFGQTWIRFYVYVAEENESCALQIISQTGRFLTSVDVPPARSGWPARVIIDSAGSAARRNVPLPRLPDELFPPFVTATDGLQAVFFDAAPNWDEPRRQAFLDWLFRGGTAYVLQGPNGAHPAFPAALQILNGPLDEQIHGAGRIFRLEFDRASASRDRLIEVLRRTLPPRLQTNADGNTEELSPLDRQDDEVDGPSAYADFSDPMGGASFLTRLKKMTKPEHNWLLLHLLFWVYIGLVFPGCYLVGQKLSDYRAVYGALLLTVAVFSGLFAVVGRRGYGEATAVHSLAIAHALSNGQADVTQWSNAFVTGGGDYAIQHDGVGGLYSSANTIEQVRRWIRNGAEAQFLADIPPFSSREFAHRIKTALLMPQCRLAELKQTGGSLQGTKIAIGTPGVPQDAEMLTLLHGNRFYQVQRNAEQLTVGSAMGSAVGFLRVQEFNSWQYGGPWAQRDQPAIEQFRAMFTPLMARSLSVRSWGDAEALSLPPHIVRLMYFAPMPAALAIRSSSFGRQEGWVLYCVDIPLEAVP